MSDNTRIVIDGKQTATNQMDRAMNEAARNARDEAMAARKQFAEVWSNYIARAQVDGKEAIEQARHDLEEAAESVRLASNALNSAVKHF